MKDNALSVYRKKLASLRNELNDAYDREVNNGYSTRYDELIRQHHREALAYENLSQEDKDYIKEKHITEEEYKQMTQLEKEVLFRCRY